MAVRSRGQKNKATHRRGAADKGAATAHGLRPVIAVGVALLLVGLGWALSKRSAWPESLVSGSASGFNVLVVTFDTTRSDRIGCYGYPGAQTPVLDALSEGGIRFGDAVTVTPMTLPAHATIFTGLYPPNHGVRSNGEFVLDAAHETLAEVLQRNGYQTSAFVSAFVLDAQFGLGQGFEHFDDDLDAEKQQPAGLLHEVNQRTAGATTDAAIGWLNSRDPTRPFFSWVHYYDPHRPFNPPPPFAKRFPGQLYDAEIAYADAQLGRLIRALDKNGSLNKTLLLVVGDHGEGMGDHGEDAHSTLIYGSVMRVPLLLSCPDLFAGPYVVDDVVVSVTDLFPTVLDLLGIEHAPAIDGESLLKARSNVDRVVYMENLATYFDNGWAPLYGLRRHTEKYILAPRPEFYLLRSDPGELNNVYRSASGGAAGVRDQLAADLEERLAEQPTLEAVIESVQPLDIEGLQALQSLGYVGSVVDMGDPNALADPKDMMPVLQAIGRANSLSGQGQHEQALSILEQALALSPHHRKLPLMIGQLHLYLGRIDPALDMLRKAMPDVPFHQVAIVAAQTLTEASLPAKAAEVLERARLSAPDDLDVLTRLGVSYLKSDRPEEARDVLLAAELLDSTSLEVFINLAACHRRLENPSEALHYVNKSIELSPDTAQAHLTRGLILKGMKEDESALDSLQTANGLNPRNPSIVQELANVCMRLRLYSEASEHFKMLVAILPTRWEPHLGLGNLYLMVGQLDAAAEEVRVGLSMAPNQPRLRALAKHLAELQDP